MFVLDRIGFMLTKRI